MSHSDTYRMKLALCGLLMITLLIGPCLAYDLIIDKNVIGGPYHVGDGVEWNISVKNNDTAGSVNVTVEDIGLVNVTSVSGEVTQGDFDPATMTWTINGLEAGDMAFLTLLTTFSYPEEQTNIANITLINESAPDTPLNDSATVSIEEALSATMVIKPETVNLKSKGAFTVFINVTGSLAGERGIDLENSTLTCNESVLRKVIVTGEGNLIAKFDRTSLNVTANDSVTISCMGDVMINGSLIHVAGSDTIRVIKEKQTTASLLDKLLKFLGLKDDDNVETTEEDAYGPLSLPETIQNLGQAKKYLKENPMETASDDGDTGITEEEDEEFEITHGGKPEKEPKDNTPPVTECNEGNCKGGKNKGS
jgi:hypothetical protein